MTPSRPSPDAPGQPAEPRVTNLAKMFSRFTEHWSPKIVAELNGSEVKLVKIRGEFVWHHHDHEDELFLVVKGRLDMQYRAADGSTKTMAVNQGEFIVMPRGVEHCPRADEETHILLLEPAGTLNTGNLTNERTVAEPESWL